MVPSTSSPESALPGKAGGAGTALNPPPADPQVLPGRNTRILLGLLLLGFSWPVVKMLVNVFEHNPDYSHGYVVPIVALYALHLGWADRNRIPARASWLGFPLLGFGMALMVFGSWYKVAIHHDGLGTEFLCAVGLVAAITGSVISLFGLRRSWYFAFPLLYLLFAIPFPESVTLKVTLPLREIISIMAGRLISLVGIHVYQEGNLLHLAGASLGVEDACSGIRSLWAMLAGSVAIAYVARCNRWQIAVVTLVSIPLAMVQNLARVFITALLVHYLDIKYAEGWRHETVGWITFILAGMALFYFALRISAKTYEQYLKQTKPDGLLAPRPPPRHYHTTALPVYTAVALLLAGGAAAQAVIHHHYNNDLIKAKITADYEARQNLADFPAQVGDFTLRGPSDIHESQLEMLDPSDHFGGQFVDPAGNQVSALLFYWRPTLFRTREFNKHPHPAEICLPASGFKTVPLKAAPPIPAAWKEEYLAALFSNGQQDMAVVYWRSAELWHRDYKSKYRSFSDRLFIMKKSWGEPAMSNGAEFSVGLYAPVVTTPEAALDAAMRLARALGPRLQPYGLRACRYLPKAEP